MNSRRFEQGRPFRYYPEVPTRGEAYRDIERELGEYLLTFMREHSITKGTILVNNTSPKEGHAWLTVTLYWEEQ